jgi:pimeloyl-ACP methyl ester carboxylesterase
VADLDIVVDHLRRTLGREKVILVGHSWGTALGLLYARAHPEKIAAFVGVAQVVTPMAADSAQRAFVETEARRRGDENVLRELAELKGPPFATEDELRLERLVDRYGGLYHHKPNFTLTMLRGMAAGYVRPWGLRRIFHANEVSLKAMAKELYGLDMRRDAPSVAVPVVFMLGRYDRHVEANQAAAYFQALEAPSKRLMWFENSAHNAPFEEPDLFNAALPKLLAEVGVPVGAGGEILVM